MTDSYHAFFHIETVPDRLIETAIEQCVECGFDTIKDGGDDYIQEYETVDHEFGRNAGDPNDGDTSSDLSNIATEISEAGEGTVTLWYNGIEFKLSFHVQSGQEWHIPKINAKFWRVNITPNKKLTGEGAQDRINHFLKAIKSLTTEFDPEFAYCDILDRIEQVYPEERPIADQIEYIPWVTVLSPQLVEEFGGYERVLATPAWQVEELKSGHVLIVRTDNPVMPAEGPRISSAEYLLEGKSLREIREDDEIE